MTHVVYIRDIARPQHDSVNTVYVHYRGSNVQPRSTEHVCFIYRHVFLNEHRHPSAADRHRVVARAKVSQFYLHVIYLFLVYLMTHSVD